MCIDARKTSLTGVQNSNKKNRLAATRLGHRRFVARGRCSASSLGQTPPWKKARSAPGLYKTPGWQGSATSVRKYRVRKEECTCKVSLYKLRLRLYLFCEGRISVLKRRFKTPIQNAVHGSRLFMLPSRRRRFREHALRMRSLRLLKEACLGILGIFNPGYCSSSSEPERRLYDVI